MKVKTLLIIAILFSFIEGFAQENKKYMPRHQLQQIFIVKQFKSTDNKINIETIDQLDSKLLDLEKAWRKYVYDSLASNSSITIPVKILCNLDAYSYLSTLYILTGKRKHPQQIQFHLLKNYMLPSLLEDMESLKQDIENQSDKIVWSGSLENTFIMGSLYFDDKDVVDHLHMLLIEFEKLLSKLQKNPDQEIATYSQKLLNSLKNYKYDINAKYFFANQQEDKALVNFITGVSTNMYLSSRIAPFSKVLISYFTKKGEEDKAFAILNNIMFSTSNDQISRDSVKMWYSSVDSIRGTALYKQANEKLGGRFLIPSEVTLSSLPKEWDFLDNNLKQDKLQKAQYILLDFWYTGCKPCIEEVPQLNELHEKLKERDDVVFISINTDYFNGNKDKRFTKGTIEKYRIRFPVVFDNDTTNISNELNIKGYPTKIIIGRDGKVLEKVDDSEITLRSFEELLSRTK